MQNHTIKRLGSGEYSCSCGRVWDYDEGCECPGRDVIGEVIAEDLERRKPVPPSLAEFAVTQLAGTPTAEQLSALLPGTYYMDPPDGGDVSLLEQLRRMAEDARRWRAVSTFIRSADQ